MMIFASKVNVCIMNKILVNHSMENDFHVEKKNKKLMKISKSRCQYKSAFLYDLDDITPF